MRDAAQLCLSRGWALCETAQGDTEPQTATAADSWSSHWDTGIQGSLGIRPRGTASSQHSSSSCLQGSCNGRTEASSGADTAQTWSHPAQAAQARASTCCSSPIPPGCRISPGTHPNHISQGRLDQARWGQACGGRISCGWLFLDMVWLPHVHATPGCSHWPCHTSSYQKYQ